MDWKIQEDEWVYGFNGTWQGILYRDASGDEVEGKFLDIEGKTKEEAVLNGMNSILRAKELDYGL